MSSATPAAQISHYLRESMGWTFRVSSVRHTLPMNGRGDIFRSLRGTR